MNPQSHPKQSQLRTVLTMIANPGEVIKNQMIRVPWPYTILISGLAFTLFFSRPASICSGPAPLGLIE